MLASPQFNSTAASRKFIVVVGLLWTLVFLPQHARAQDGQSTEISLGALQLYPRPRLGGTFSLAVPFGSVRLGGGMRVSYANLNSSFKDAAESSEYASKLPSTTAYMWDSDLTLPEITFNPFPFLFTSLSSDLRLTRCVSHYTTSAGEPLTFSGWGVSTGVNIGTGTKLFTSPGRFSVEALLHFHVPFWSTGLTDLSYERDSSTAVETFSEANLDAILNSLQPFMEQLTKQTTAGFGVRGVFKF